MKKLTLVLVVGLLAVSCDAISISKTAAPGKYLKSVSNTGGSIALRLIKLQGHDYVVMDGHQQGGICHAESCPCKGR